MARHQLRLVVLALAASLVGLLAVPAFAAADGVVPPAPHSPNADDTQSAYVIMLVIGAIAVVAINGALLMALSRFGGRHREDARQIRSGRGIQIRLTGALTLAAAAIVVLGIVFTESMRDVEPTGPDGYASTTRTAQLDLSVPAGDEDENALEIQVSGQRWLWRYEYPDEVKPDPEDPATLFSYQELVVPADTTVRLQMLSTDVAHRWWVPALGGQAEVIPGEENQTWFRADAEGTYDGASTQYSGPGYATMRPQVRVVSPDEFDQWAAEQFEGLREAQEAVQEAVTEGGPIGVSER